MKIIINIFLIVLGIYFLLGLIFGIIFLFKAPKIDPLMTNSQKKVRVLLLPGTIAVWPFMIGKLFKSKIS